MSALLLRIWDRSSVIAASLSLSLSLSMDSKDGKVEMFFLPCITARGHLIPMMDAARVFAAHGAKVTIIITPYYAKLYQKSIEQDQSLGHEIDFHTFELPTSEFGLPEGCENQLSISFEMSLKLFKAIEKLQEPIEQLLRERCADCIVSDMFFPWTAISAARLGIPRLLFHVTGLFPLCCDDSLKRHAPHEKVNSDTETFILPGLPDDNIKFSKRQLPFWYTAKADLEHLQDNMQEAKSKTYGVIVNESGSSVALSCGLTLSPSKTTSDGIRRQGPAAGKGDEQKTKRGEKNSIDGGTVLNWFNSKEPKSVLYVSFGSQVRMAPEQFLEIAHGLEISGCPFIWVGRDMLEYGDDEKNNEGREGRGGKKLPDGFEERMMKSGKGLIVRSWAPQLLILEHQAIGGFLTHCEWNSAIEGIGAGVPMITWPITAEHFFVENLVTDVLKTGIRVGNKEWMWLFWEPKVTVARDKVEEAVKWLMGGGGGDEAKKMRIRAKEFGVKAKKAVDYGGSSHADVIALINDLKSRRR
ncbi:unnamed protein product [Camellia sinensis]